MLRRSSSVRFIKGFGGSFFSSGGGGGGSSGGNLFKSFSFPFSGNDSSGGGGGGGGLGSFFNKALEWCSTSHAWDIARQEGIDMRDIKFETTTDGGVNVFVDAPTATQQQIEQLGRRVEKECPVAMIRKTQVKGNSNKEMKWLRLPDKYDR